MSDRVSILIEDDRWTSVDLAGLAETCLTETLLALDLGQDYEISVLACDDARIADLNASFRAKHTATNVLSWPIAELSPDTPGAAPHPPDQEELGDIALAFDTIAAEAQASGLSLNDHTMHLLIHAILHLLGHDHQTEADAQRMEGLEIATLAKLGIANPY